MTQEMQAGQNRQAAEELRQGLQRVQRLLAGLLARQRDAGREAASEALRGVAIEPGEAEMLMAELGTELARPASGSSAAPEMLPPATRSALPAQGRPDTPLEQATRVFRLGALDLDALLLCLAVEIDGRFARLVAYLNDHIARTRPTIGLLLGLTGNALGAVAFSQRPALRLQLLLLDGDGPLPGQALRLAPELLTRLAVAGSLAPLPPGLRLHAAGGPALTALVLPEPQRQALQRWAGAIAAGALPAPLLLAGPPGAGRRSVARATAAAAGRALVELDWSPDYAQRLSQAAREALWHDAVLLLRIDNPVRGAEAAALWAALQAWPLPVALAATDAAMEGLRAAAGVEGQQVLALRLEPPSIAQRVQLWGCLLASEHAAGRRHSLQPADLEDLAARYDFRPGLLARALRRAASDHGAPGAGARLDFDCLARACRAVGSDSMGAIAQRLAQPYTRDDLVLAAPLMQELDLASAWIRSRQQVFERWGFGRRIALGRGLTALFAGGSGTGKTMTAQVLARELGLELFRVDLSRVMSKYIGETEKNLSQLFDEATASGAILFFDEADALFGKRSEVKDAHDRYANLEISYLLQRMEEHEGVSVLATNRASDLDEAFTRRFHFILDFPLPGPAERLRIWQGMLPQEAAREDTLALEMLAEEHELSGGEIRNSVLSAAFIAAAEGVPIGLRHLKRGLRRELLKVGRVLDSQQRGALDG